MSGLARDWADLLPDHGSIGADLLARWSEPHRRYHDLSHLAHALVALAEVGGTSRPERLAIWFHDAVHTGRAGRDERDSAALAARLLATAGLAPAEISEVERLVLVTIEHAPAPADAAGARVSDADLAILGAPPEQYRASVAALRAELATEGSGDWPTVRLARVAALLAADPLFHTAPGRALWLDQARRNLLAEQRSLGNTATGA